MTTAQVRKVRVKGVPGTHTYTLRHDKFGYYISVPGTKWSSIGPFMFKSEAVAMGRDLTEKVARNQPTE